MTRSSKVDSPSSRENSSWKSLMYRLRALRSTPRISFLRRATVAFWRAISSRIWGDGVVGGGLIDMRGRGSNVRSRPLLSGVGSVAWRDVQLPFGSLFFGSPCSPSCMASLKLRMPAPRPRASSGIFFPPKISSRMTKISISSGTPIEPIGCTPRATILDPDRGLVNDGRRKDQALVALPARHARLIEVLQERDGVLAARAAQFLELRDVDERAPGALLPEAAFQVLERLRVEHLAVRDADQPAAAEEQVEQAFDLGRLGAQRRGHLVQVGRVAAGGREAALDLFHEGRFLRRQRDPVRRHGDALFLHPDRSRAGQLGEQELEHVGVRAREQTCPQLFPGKPLLERLPGVEGPQGGDGPLRLLAPDLSR